MPLPKCTLVSHFIFKALHYTSYPATIFYESINSNTVCINLINLNNGEKASETRRMLKDHAALKPRKLQEKGSDRHRFLQALKKSPYVKILPESSKDRKFIKLKENTTLQCGCCDFKASAILEEIQYDTLDSQMGNQETASDPPLPTFDGVPGDMGIDEIMNELLQYPALEELAINTFLEDKCSLESSEVNLSSLILYMVFLTVYEDKIQEQRMHFLTS